MPGAVFGEVQVSLFVAGALFGEVQVSYFVAGAVFGEVQVALFVAGTVFGEIWTDGRSAKRRIFPYRMCLVSPKSNLSCAAGCGLTDSWSDHARIILGPAARCKCRFSCFQQISVIFWTVIFRGKGSIW